MKVPTYQPQTISLDELLKYPGGTFNTPQPDFGTTWSKWSAIDQQEENTRRVQQENEERQRQQDLEDLLRESAKQKQPKDADEYYAQAQDVLKGVGEYGKAFDIDAQRAKRAADAEENARQIRKSELEFQRLQRSIQEPYKAPGIGLYRLGPNGEVNIIQKPEQRTKNGQGFKPRVLRSLGDDPPIMVNSPEEEAQARRAGYVSEADLRFDKLKQELNVLKDDAPEPEGPGFMEKFHNWLSSNKAKSQDKPIVVRRNY